MSLGAVLGFAFGALGPAALLFACIFELLSRRMAKTPRPDEAKLERLRRFADIGLVAAWLCLGAAYLCFQSFAPDRVALTDTFQTFMTWILLLLVILDVVYLLLRRARPRNEQRKQYFWEK